VVRLSLLFSFWVLTRSPEAGMDRRRTSIFLADLIDEMQIQEKEGKCRTQKLNDGGS